MLGTTIAHYKITAKLGKGGTHTHTASTLCIALGIALIGCKTREPIGLGVTQVPATISPEAQTFLKKMRGNIIENYLLDAQGEYVLDDRHREGAPDMRLEETNINGVKAFWVSSQKASGRDFVIVYFHGGGFVEGTGDEDGGILLPVFEAAGVRGLSVDYRLAPEHPFPAAVEDAKNVVVGLMENGYRPDQIALTGDSAGGGLVLAATFALKEEDHPLPGAVVAISPGAELTISHDSAITLADWDPFVVLSDARENGRIYAGKTPISNPQISPVNGNYEGFPPLLIQVGTREVLLSDAVLVARKARQDGADVTLDVWEGMWHGWHMTWPDVPEARKACEEMANFIQLHINADIQK